MTGSKRKSAHNRVLIFIIGFLFLIPSAWPSGVFGSDPGLELFHEAVTKVRTHSLRQVPPPPPPKDGRYRKAIKEYARQTDKYSDYLTPDEFKSFSAGFAPDYYGVGMNIAESPDGDIVCYPFPRGPAEKAGLRPMDKLVYVDGKPVKDRSVYVIGAMVRGRAGTVVTLSIRRDANPAIRHFHVVRGKIDLKTVYLIKAKIPIIRITGFSGQTPKELARVLRTLTPGRAKIIDLRGNDGGDLLASLEAASLFLPQNVRLLEIRTRLNNTVHVTEKPPTDLESPIYIWQDNDTASAAEVFLAALTQNNRAISIGERSYGKGVSQKPIPLSDGSALFLTFADLRGPNGIPFHKKGLVPDYPVPKGSAKDNRVYMAVIMNLTMPALENRKPEGGGRN